MGHKMGKRKYYGTQFQGVQYRVHETRKFGRSLDKYFTIRYRVNGKRKHEAIGWASEGFTADGANLLLAELKQAAKTGKGPVTLKEKEELKAEERRGREKEKQLQKEKSQSLSDAGTEYLSYIELESPTTLKREKELFENQIYRFWEKEKPIREISEEELKAFRNFLLKKGSAKGKPLAPRTAQYALLVMGKLLKFSGIVNHASKVKVPKYDNKALRFLSKEEVGLLFKEVKKRSTDVYNMAIISLHLGLRAGEVLSLEVAHVNFSQENIQILDPKNKITRTLFMTAQVEQILKECCKGKKLSHFVFPNNKGKRRTAISKSFMSAVNKLGLNEGVTDSRLKVKIHTLRHTYASWLIMSGDVDLYTLQKLLGHQDIKTTERYAHLAPDHYRESAKVMESEFSKVHLSELVHT